MSKQLPYVWDYDLEEEQFKRILFGELSVGRLDQDWALLRLFEYAPYSEITRLLSFKQIVEWWPKVRDRMRSEGRMRGFDFLVQWLPREHPEL